MEHHGVGVCYCWLWKAISSYISDHMLMASSCNPSPTHRVLHIPLMNAERAWAYSQSLKAQATNKPSATLRTRVLGRLHRASSSARELAALAAATCDAATCAEAEAYAAWMTALWVAERGQDWPKALAKYQRTRCVGFVWCVVWCVLCGVVFWCVLCGMMHMCL